MRRRSISCSHSSAQTLRGCLQYPLLRSPYFRIAGEDDQPIREGEIAALDRALSEAGYLGGLDALDRLVESWQREGSRVSRAAVRGASILRTGRARD